MIRSVEAAVNREEWDDYERLWAPDAVAGSRRKMLGFTQNDLSDGWQHRARRLLQTGEVRLNSLVIIVVRGERLALTRMSLGSADMSPGAPRDELLILFGLGKDGRIALQVAFDLDDMDGAIAELEATHARFEEPQPERRRLENKASQVNDRLFACFAARDWNAMADILAQDSSTEDHRRVVNADQQGRDALIASFRSAAELGVTHATSDAIATRGERLVLTRARYVRGDKEADAFQSHVLQITEIDANERIASVAVFDVDDIDAAFEELDARYLSGEAAAYSQMWSAVARTNAAFKRHELPESDWVTIDHRRGTLFDRVRQQVALSSSNQSAFIRFIWDLTPDLSIHIEAVHRLSSSAAVVTSMAYGTSPEGFEAEWRGVYVLTVEGDVVNRCELYDEPEIDAALAKFEQLSRPTPRLENAASRLGERYLTYFASGDWDAVAQILADSVSIDDRRRVVGAGVRHGRAALTMDMRAVANLSVMKATSSVIAIRGEQLTVMRAVFSGRGQRTEAFLTEVLVVFEINADEQIVAVISFDANDFDAAFTELDARYLAGEAARYSDIWSVIARGHAAVNRQELPPTSPDCVSIDHRRGTAFAPGELIEYFRAGWDLEQHIRTYVETVHLLTDLGAVCTHVGHGISRDGFDAEWRGVDLLTVESNLVNRCEVFDEADLDAALARFEELRPQTRRLENAATRAWDRFRSYFEARDWNAIADIHAEDHFGDDRRRMVGSGVQRGRDASVENLRVIADLVETMTADVIATRGERLALTRTRFLGPDLQPQANLVEVLGIVETNLDDRLAAFVAFDPDDIDAAFEELEARYIAGEAAAQSRTWSVISSTTAALNRNQLAATTPDWVAIDHRRGMAFASGEQMAYVRAAWDLAPDRHIYFEAVNRLNDLGAVVTWAAYGTSEEGFDAEWRGITISTVEGDRVTRSELFDETDLDAALARFEQLSQPTPRLENAASQVAERFVLHLTAGNGDAIAELLSDDFSQDDRRRVVGAGLRHGRDAEILDMRTIGSLGFTKVTTTVMATRGERLALIRTRFALPNAAAEPFVTEVLGIAENDTRNRIRAHIVFDVHDIDVAFEELDARYLVGEAAAHAHTWAVLTRARSTLTQRGLFPTTPDWVNIDHRRGIAFTPGDLTEYIRSAWNLLSDGAFYFETVHRLSDFGAVVTWWGYGTSQEGSHVEFRGINTLTVEGDRVSRCEIFDETDLDAAIAAFDQLSRQVRRPQNAASHVAERFLTNFAARDWDALSEMLADDFSTDDRRRVVGVGVRPGRDAQIAAMRATADLWMSDVTSTAVATRGSRLVMMHGHFSHRGQGPEAFLTELLGIVEINADERVVALVLFDPDDIDAAFAELETRYLVGEAGAHAHKWSVIAASYAALNRRETLPATPDWVNIDHRRHGTSFAPGELPALLATWNLAPNVSSYVETVHRLNDFGAVLSSVSHETSPDGVNAEWRVISVLTVEGDQVNRLEIFDEKDFDVALATFDQLSPPEPRLENAASQAYERFWACYAARDWDAMYQLLAADLSTDDCRRVVNEGTRRGRDAEIASMRALAAVVRSDDVTSTVIATRGGRLALSRVRSPAFQTEVLNVVELDADELIAAVVGFDANDIDTAFAELETRYLAGEAAAHSHTWSVITTTYAAFNKHERALPDWVVIDHRPGALFASSGMTAAVHAFWEQTPDLRIRIEAVHRLSDLGAVVAHAANGTSPEGFAAEWRMIQVLTVEGDQVGRCELFDEADLDAANARFEELHPARRRLDNAAHRLVERCFACAAAGDWAAVSDILADDILSDDRRRAVNFGQSRGRDAVAANLRRALDLGDKLDISPPLATRGRRLVLNRLRWSANNQGPEAFPSEALCITEVNSDERIAASLMFDLDEFDSAIEELDARFLAGEAACNAKTWSAIAAGYASLNRGVIPQTTQDWAHIDHRLRATLGARDLTPYLRTAWELTPDLSIWVEEVHRLNDLGAVVTHTSRGTSREGFAAEWRMIELLTVDGDLINRSELFDEADLDSALARFEELHPPPPRLENAASRASNRLVMYYAARDWDAAAETLADTFCSDDRRHVVNAGIRHGRDVAIANMKKSADLQMRFGRHDTIATRGERLVLSRAQWSGPDHGPDAFYTDILHVVEVDAEERVASRVMFDSNDIDAAFAELDARYLAGDAANYSRTWSVAVIASAAFNRQEHPATTPDLVYIDHRPVVSIEGVELAAAQRAMWDLTSEIGGYIEAVHRLNEYGTVAAQVLKATSREGSEAELHMIHVVTVEGDLMSRVEVFDEGDLDAALARFDELNPQTPRLKNAVAERFLQHFAARDWDALGQLFTDDYYHDDRRRVVNAGVRHGRDAAIEDLRVSADIGLLSDITATVVATRGERLILTHFQASGPDHPAIQLDVLQVIAYDADERITAAALFDVEGIDAAFAELEARYLAGEAAVHSRTWSVIAGACAAFNRHELAATTTDSVYIDHRPVVAVEAVDLDEFTRATWNTTPDVRIYIEAVHKLSDLGAVVTHTARGISRAGFDAEWRMVDVYTVDGDLISRNELFDEADLDAALARFEELHPHAASLENAASRAVERFLGYFAARNWAAIGEILAENCCIDDRRRVVNAGFWNGRKVVIANMRALDEGGAHITRTVIATRGERLALTRICSSNRDPRHGDYVVEMLGIGEINSDERFTAHVLFDPDDIDTAYEELEARYLAGEAAAHAQTWMAISAIYGGFNRREPVATTPDSICIDHRPLMTVEPIDLPAAVRAIWHVAPDIRIHMVAVYRLSDLGAVVTIVARGTSQEGFDAEWRMINLYTVEGNLISRNELFDEADLDAALARFNELDAPPQP